MRPGIMTLLRSVARLPVHDTVPARTTGPRVAPFAMGRAVEAGRAGTFLDRRRPDANAPRGRGRPGYRIGAGRRGAIDTADDVRPARVVRPRRLARARRLPPRRRVAGASGRHHDRPPLSGHRGGWARPRRHRPGSPYAL